MTIIGSVAGYGRCWECCRVMTVVGRASLFTPYFVGSSIQSGGSGRVAQWIEHQPSKLTVAGSSPASLTTSVLSLLSK